VLGLLVERVTGRPFVSELSRRLLEPLGMEGTGMLLQPGAPFLMSPSWASAFGTSGAMYSSAYDLLRWGDALYAGHVLHPASRSRMLAMDEHEYGLGLQEIEVGKQTGYGHSGLLRGFTSVLVHLPRQDLTLVVMGTTQSFDPASLLAHADKGKPSLLQLALEAAGADAPD
jgi:D-alanyl-D-alanine carboxypeptidase